jgi:hypothetical protein
MVIDEIKENFDECMDLQRKKRVVVIHARVE